MKMEELADITKELRDARRDDRCAEGGLEKCSPSRCLREEIVNLVDLEKNVSSEQEWRSLFCAIVSDSLALSASSSS